MSDNDTPSETLGFWTRRRTLRAVIFGLESKLHRLRSEATDLERRMDRTSSWADDLIEVATDKQPPRFCIDIEAETATRYRWTVRRSDTHQTNLAKIVAQRPVRLYRPWRGWSYDYHADYGYRNVVDVDQEPMPAGKTTGTAATPCRARDEWPGPVNS